MIFSLNLSDLSSEWHTHIRFDIKKCTWSSKARKWKSSWLATSPRGLFSPPSRFFDCQTLFYTEQGLTSQTNIHCNSNTLQSLSTFYSCCKIVPTLVMLHYKFLLSQINIRSWMRCDLIKATVLWTLISSLGWNTHPRLSLLTTTGHWPTAWGGNNNDTSSDVQWIIPRPECSHTAGQSCWYESSYSVI